MNTAYLLLGSNIKPGENIPEAIALLQSKLRIVNVSSIWETHAIRNNGPNFLNCVLFIETEYSIDEIKMLVISSVEAELGRVRTQDKHAPRTIDIDLIIYNGQELDEEICKRIFIAVPLAELNPGFYCKKESMTIKDVADALRKKEFIRKWQLKKVGADN